MADKIIKDESIATNEWNVIIDKTLVTIPSGKVVIPLEMWQQNSAALLSRETIPGLVIQPDDEVTLTPDELKRIPLVVIMFPVFTDGRGFSIAARLREEYGYQGEIRAKGHFIRDQLYYMKRCGFDSFEFDNAIDLNEALKSLNDFTNDYQRSSNQPLPLFRRRH